MNSIHLQLTALLLAFLLATDAGGQDSSSQILARGRVATVGVDTTSDQNLDQSGRSGFPSFSSSRDKADPNDSGSGSTGKHELAGSAITMISSLVVVLGLFGGLVWMTRKFGSRGMSQGAIPREVLQSLGSVPLDARTRITMVRCGDRILVMAQTATGVHPLAEITDRDEVRELSAACLGDARQAFASALKSIEHEKAQPGYVGSQKVSPTSRGSRRLFASA